jgi:hypothetical protein
MSAIGDKIKDATQNASSNRIGNKLTSKHYDQTQRVLNKMRPEYNFTPEMASTAKDMVNTRVAMSTARTLPTLIEQKKAEKAEQERWDNLSVPEKIVDPFKTMGANMKHTELGLKESQAWTEYRSKQDEESLAKAQEATKTREEYEASNDRIGKGNAFTKDFAGYIPQMLGQIGAGVGNAAGGAAAGAGTALAIGQLGPQVGLPEELITVPTGALWGGRAGYVAGTGKYNYDLVVGTAYKTLLDMGVPNDIALELSGNEAVINGAIEALGSVVDLASFGAGSAAKEPLKRFLTGAVKSYVANLISEPTEEGLQRKVSIEIEKEAAKRAGIERNVSEAEDWQSILDDMKSARNVALFTGLGNVGGNIVNNVMQTNKNTNSNTRKLPTIDSKTLNQLTEISKNIEEQKNVSETASTEKNVASELPTMASRQAMLPTNQTEGKTVQNDNIEQIAENREKVSQFSKETDVAGEKPAFSLSKSDNQGRNLTTEQQAFFKDSKARDENGNLQVMYHGTNGEFTKFNKGAANGWLGKGIYLTTNKDYAKKQGKKTIAVYANLNNPFVSKSNDPFSFISEVQKIYPEADSFNVAEVLQKNGYDGIIYTHWDEDVGKMVNVFEPNQIKNVDNTKPTSNPDIRYFASSESSRPYMDLDRYTSRDNKSKANKVGLTDIQNAINDIVTVKTGKFRQNAYGIYKTKGEIIRLKQMKDIPVALHELTHHLDKMYNLSSSDKAFNELKKIAVVGENATNQTIISEGVAEFGRYYMTDKEYAKEIAPFYYDAFERALDSDPAMKNKVENIRQMVTNYLDQSPLNRLSSNIDYGDEDISLWQKGKDTIIKTANNFRKNFVDDLDPLKKIVNEISGDKKLMTEEDAYKLLRLNNGVTGKVQVALEYGVLNGKGEKVSKSLKEILEPVSNNQKEFVAYLTALRANDLQNRGIESGMLSRDIADVIKMYKGNETFNNAAKELYNFQNKILETTLIDSGIITKDALDAYNKNNPHYVPFYRVMDENFKQSKSSKSKKPTKIKGSTRDIINPLESIIKNTYSYMQMAERNDTFKVLFDMANKYDGTGKWFDKVPTDMLGTKVTAEDVKGILEQLNLGDEDVNYNEIFTTLFKPVNNQKGNIVTVMQKGKPVHYEIMDKELFDILSPETKGENIIVKLLSPASKALRVGATHTPVFVLRNPLRDTMDAGIYSKNGFIPFVDTIRGLFDVAGRSDLYYKWLQSGGSGSTYTNAQRPVLQKTLKGLTQGTTNEKDIKTALNRAVELAKHPLRTYLDVAGTISNVAEEATRVGEFKRALEKGKSEKTAALDSREITLDFSRGGKVAKDINKVVAFFNAELQGLDKMFTSFKDRPLATTIKGIAYLTIPAMILRALQDEEELEKVPQWEKDEFFIVFAGDTPIKIPKPQGLGQLFATFPERIVDFIRTQDKDAFDGFVQRLVTSYVPIDSTTAIFPNLFLPLIENSANYSFFKQQPIVKQSLQNRSPKYQYDENTSTIAKSIGNIFNVSPKKVDNLISGYFGNLGKDVANLAGKPIELFNGDKKENEYKSFNSKLKQIPLVKGFVASDYASKTLDKFYEDKTKANTQYTDAKFKSSEGKMTYAEQKELQYYKDLNSIYTSAYNDIKDVDEQIDKVTNGTGTDKYKELRIEQLRKQKDKIAETAEVDAKKLKAKNKLITEAEKKNKLFEK